MRVISGKARGTKIDTIESITTRPTLDRVKESLFNIIQGKIEDAVVVDLFAGSGALGIEALSRGAKKAYFCDCNKAATSIIKNNLSKTRLIDKAIITTGEYKNCLDRVNEKVNIIFIDPPYKIDIAIRSLKEILKKNLMEKDGIIVIETDEIKRDISELNEIKEVKIIDQRKYGRANLIFIKEEN